MVDSRVQEFTVSTLPIGGVHGPSVMLLVAARVAVVDAASAAAYLTRCRGLPTYLDQCGEWLRTAAASRLLPVAPLVDSVIARLREHLAHPTATRCCSSGHQRAGTGRRRGGTSCSASSAMRSVRRWDGISTCSLSCCPGHGRPSKQGCRMCRVGWRPTPAASATAPRSRWTPRSCTSWA